MTRILLLLLCLLLFTTPCEAAPPDWLTALFPYMGKPDRQEHRLTRLDAGEVAVNGRMGGWVTFELTFPGVDGREESGKLRLFLPPEVRENPSRRVPLIHNAGYELDENGARGLLAKGYAVCTPHAHPLNPLGRGFNLDRAILHAVRQLSCIDPLRVSIQGGSAGGWMTLMLTADAFPLVWAMPDVPPIHWGYNAAYINGNNALAGPPPGSDKPRMLYLQMVNVITEQGHTTYGLPFDSPTYFATSPLAHLDTITVPTLVTFSTADILVPVDQVSPKLIRPREASLFPAGYSTELTSRFPGVRGKRTLLEALPRNRYELFLTPLPTEFTRTKIGGTPPPGLKPISLPFSQEKLWSIVVVDEGAVEPGSAHTKYVWGMDHEPFRRWADGQGVSAAQLTAPKLERLMKRVLGEAWRPFQIRPGGKGAERAGNALDYPEAERADVLLGLTAFAQDDARAEHLARLYAKLPARLRVFGKTLGDGTAAGVRAALSLAKGK